MACGQPPRCRCCTTWAAVPGSAKLGLPKSSFSCEVLYRGARPPGPPESVAMLLPEGEQAARISFATAAPTFWPLMVCSAIFQCALRIAFSSVDVDANVANLKSNPSRSGLRRSSPFRRGHSALLSGSSRPM